MSEQSLALINQSAEAIKNQDFETALHLADQAIALDASASDAHTMRGIALSQLRQADSATAAFQQAIALDPTSVKAFYNFATHLYSQGRKQDALTYANQALAREPGHSASMNLVRLIEQEFSAPEAPPSPGMPYSEPPTATPYMREGYGPPRGGSNTIPFISKLGPTWLVIGWLLAIVSAAQFVYSISLVAPIFNDVMKQITASNDTSALQAKIQSVMPPWLSVVSLAAQIGCLTWMIMDLIHRRGNFLWLVPMILCTCCGFQFMVLPIYIVTGRGNKA
jgi:tetratricopeptide (TPR) repeat protein